MSEASIRVRLFSVLRERLGRDRLDLPAEDIATVGEALDRLARAYPEIAQYRRWIRPAVNQAYASDAAPLGPNDELALITPVSGG